MHHLSRWRGCLDCYRNYSCPCEQENLPLEMLSGEWSSHLQHAFSLLSFAHLRCRLNHFFDLVLLDQSTGTYRIFRGFSPSADDVAVSLASERKKVDAAHTESDVSEAEHTAQAVLSLRQLPEIARKIVLNSLPNALNRDRAFSSSKYTAVAVANLVVTAHAYVRDVGKGGRTRRGDGKRLERLQFVGID